MDSTLKQVCCNFKIPGTFLGGDLYGNGHINTTYKIQFLNSGKATNYILQKINTGIFKNPYNLMENAVRFLADHLQNDVYLKIYRDGHNLDRCKTQIALVKSIEKHFDKMNSIVEKY